MSEFECRTCQENWNGADTRGRRRAKSAAEAIREAKMARMEQLRQTV